MPPPFPEPVQFDHRLAEDAIAALNSAIAVLRDHTTTDVQAAHHAMDSWTGHHADAFSQMDLPWITGESSRILNGMIQLVSTITNAAANARTLQAQQNAANQRWWQHRQALIDAGKTPMGGPI